MGEGQQVPHGSPLAASQTLLALINGHWTTQVLYVAAKLGLADFLAEGPQSADALAQATATHPETLRRLLWGLTSLGVCCRRRGRALRVDPARGRSAHGGSWLRAALGDLPRGRTLCDLGQLLHSVQTGESAFPLVRGMLSYAYFQAHPEVAATFNRAMLELTQCVAEAVVAAYDFSPFGTLVDVGGGYGTLLLAILQAHPTLRGILFDLPYVIEGDQETIVAQGCAARCAAVAGDFFQAAPSGGDVYLVNNVLRDWDDARSTVILRNCQRAAPQARLLVIEPVRPTRVEPSAAHQGALAGDLNMLVASGGQQRSEAEFAILFRAAGYQLVRLLPTASPFSILEGVPG